MKMPGEGQNELGFQAHIIKSYGRQGGHARKWSSGWVGGVPDLVCSMPVVGAHLVEVKHLPDWKGQPIKNPMTQQQWDVSQEYLAAGAKFWLAVVFGSSKANGSNIAYHDPTPKVIEVGGLSGVHPYVPGKGFDIKRILEGIGAL